MFCGIIDHVGILEAIEPKSQSTLLRIRSQWADFSLGESIAVDGMCLTVVASHHNCFDCELSPETLAITTAQQYRIGQLLNLERALCVGDRIGGHFVTGHVDQTLILDRKIQQGGCVELHFSGFSQKVCAYLVAKGSVTLNGVSLTVNRVDQSNVVVMLIPHTLAHTNLSQLEPKSHVNVEWDYMAKLVGNHIQIFKGVTS